MQETQGLSVLADGMQEELAAEDLLAGVQNMPMRLVLEAAVINFTVGNLMLLEPGIIVETLAQQNEDLMLQVNGQPVGPVKFDVSGDQLAVRLTGIA